MRFQKYLILVIALALCALAPAQFGGQIAVPGIKINKTKDDIKKNVKRGLVLYMYDKTGEVMATKSPDLKENPINLVDRKYEYDMILNFENVFVEHLKVWVPPDRKSLAGTDQSVRDAANKTRKVFKADWQELDVYQGPNNQNAFGGLLDFSGTRRGDVHMMLWNGTKHAEQTELSLVLADISNTKWRRNYLNDGIDFFVDDLSDKDLFIEKTKNGWTFTNYGLRKLTEKLGRLDDLLPPPAGTPPLGDQGSKKTDGEGTKTGDMGGGSNREIGITLDSQVFSGGACKVGDKIVVRSNKAFSVEIYRLDPGSESKPVMSQRFDQEGFKGPGYYAGLTLNNMHGKYRVDVFDGDMVLSSITVEVK